MCCAVVARDEIVEKHPEALQDLINSLVQSGLSVKSNIDDTMKIAVDFLGQSEAVVKAILQDPNERFTTDKLLPCKEELEFVQNYLIDTVKVPALSGKIDIDAFVDLRFAIAAGAR
jgi:NitT/TauT family transport system substrate-binding protein